MAQGLGDGAGSFGTGRLASYLVLVSLLLAGPLYVAGSAFANPVAVEEPPSHFLIFAYLLMALNLPVNLLVFSLALLVVSRVRGPKVGGLQDRTSRYLWSIVLSMLVVSMVGAFIDLLFVYSASDVIVIPGIDSQPARWSVATVLIFLSVLVTSHFLIGLRPESNLCVSTALALVNPVIWYVVYPWDTGIEMVVWVICAAALLDIMVLKLLAVWHEKRYLGESVPLSRLPPRALFKVTVTYFAVLGIALMLAVSVWGIRPEEHPPVSTTLTKNHDPWTESWRFSLGSVSPEDLPWSDITIALTDGANSTSWINISSSDLDDAVWTGHNYGVKILSGQDVTLTVVDLAGNGHLDMGDYFTLESPGFYEDVTYTVALVYEPTDVAIAYSDFKL